MRQCPKHLVSSFIPGARTYIQHQSMVVPICHVDCPLGMWPCASPLLRMSQAVFTVLKMTGFRLSICIDFFQKQPLCVLCQGLCLFSAPWHLVLFRIRALVQLMTRLLSYKVVLLKNSSHAFLRSCHSMAWHPTR